MRVEWFGQSAFSLTGESGKVFIDPFGDMSQLAADRGMKWDYPPISEDGVDLLLVTHEHVDHNGVDAIGGEPAIVRSTAGRAGVADRRGARRSPPSTTTPPEPSAARTRSSPSTSTAFASRTSATSASAS